MASSAAGNAADELLNPQLEERVNALLKGAMDMHCHSGPSVTPRCLDHIEAMHEASEAESRFKKWNPEKLHAMMCIDLGYDEATIRRLIGGSAACLMGVDQ